MFQIINNDAFPTSVYIQRINISLYPVCPNIMIKKI